jgi:acyl carrier protein
MDIKSSEVSQRAGEIGSNDADTEGMRKEHPTVVEIQTWLVAYLAALLEIDPDDVDVAMPFDRYGLDSSASVGLTGDLADWLGCDLDPALLSDYPTVDALARYCGDMEEIIL